MVRRMVRWVRAAALASLMLTAQACGKRPEKDAAGTVLALLTAVQTGDTQAFEASLDRPALRADLREQLVGLARTNALEVDGGPSDFALDRMITPEAFHLRQAGVDLPLASPPTAAQVAAILKPIDKTHVCVHDLSPQTRCLLTFARERPGWRLVRMPAANLRIEIPPAPPKKG